MVTSVELENLARIGTLKREPPFLPELKGLRSRYASVILKSQFGSSWLASEGVIDWTYTRSAKSVSSVGNKFRRAD